MCCGLAGRDILKQFFFYTGLLVNFLVVNLVEEEALTHLKTCTNTGKKSPCNNYNFQVPNSYGRRGVKEEARVNERL